MSADLAIPDNSDPIGWLEAMLPGIMRRLLDSENLDTPLLQLPLAQLRLAQALYGDDDLCVSGRTMGQLSAALGVRQNALTQAADRLIHNGLAERHGDERDRRVVRLRLTLKGRNWVAERKERRRGRLTQMWGAMTAGERDEFISAIGVLDSASRRLGAEDLRRQSYDRQAAATVEELVTTLSAGDFH